MSSGTDEAAQHFRVGLLVISSLVVGAVLLTKFGQSTQFWQESITIKLQLATAAGVYPSAPIMLNGLVVGQVRTVKLDDARGGVLVTAEIKKSVKLRADATARVVKTLLGETYVELTWGTARELLANNRVLDVEPPADPMELVYRLEARTNQALEALTVTGREWGSLATNLNQLLITKRGDLDHVVEQTAEALHQFTATMQSAQTLMAQTNEVISDPAVQQSLKQTMQTLPRLTEETQRTIVAAKTAIESMNRNLVNLNGVTEPLAQRGDVMVARLDRSLASLDVLLGELARFSKLANSEQGSLHQLAADPDLYNNMERATQSLSVVLRNLEPVIRDFREFSDKIARNPELLGVGGAIQPSSGLRDSEILQQPQGGAPATGSRPGLLPGRTGARPIAPNK